jgi:hypothetical protein
LTSGTTATVATQEMWEDQVGISLPRTDARASWKIIEAMRTIL